MPPPKIPPPQFSLLGRYLIDVSRRKDPSKIDFFHDTLNLKPECGVEEMELDAISRFDSKEWAVVRNFTPCPHCL